MKFMNVSALALLSVLAMGQAVRAETTSFDNHAVVVDKNGGVVHAIQSGTCVRTKWESGNNTCTDRVSRTVLTDDERAVYFAFNSAVLTPAAKANLDVVAARLAKADDVASAEIVGFADRIGSNTYNDRLSARRAAAVKDYLAKHGYLNVNVAHVKAMGEAHPVTNCPTTAARPNQIACLSPDRRVEIQLTYVDHYEMTSTR